MSFADIKGNMMLKTRLMRIIENKMIPHGIIFEGSADETDEFVNSFASAVLCLDRKGGDSCGVCNSCRKIRSGNSEDIHYFGVGEKERSVKVDTVREMKEFALSGNYTGRPIFILLKNADRMTDSAQAAILKLLEEPPENTHILLALENVEALVDTIRSRCQIFRINNNGFRINNNDDDPLSRSPTEELLRGIVEGKSYFEMQKSIDHFTKDKKRSYKFIDDAEIFFRDIMIARYDAEEALMTDLIEKSEIKRLAGYIGKESAALAIEATESARRDLDGYVSNAYALKYMIFDIQSRISRVSRM